MNKNELIYTLRQGRNALYWMLEPLDYASRKINHLTEYPPLPLRRHVGFLGGFDGVGMEFVAYLRFLLNLKSTDKILDVGCGCGMFELALEKSGFKGELTGFDIHKPCIDWCHRTISRRQPSYRFLHSDIFNPSYWPSGKLTAEQFWNQFTETGYTIVVAKSLFTHMLPDELNLYLAAISKCLAPGGRALLTFFILNKEQEQLEAQADLKFLPNLEGNPNYKVRRPHAPSAAVGYREDYLFALLEKYGFRYDVHFGKFAGRPDGLSYQDIVVVTKN